MSGLGLPGGLPLSGKWQSRTTTGFARLQFAGDGVTSLTPAASASVRSRSSPRVGGTCCSSSGASVSAALARTLARPAKAVAVTAGVSAASSACPARRSRAQVWNERSARLSASRGVARLPGAGLELIEYRHGGPVRPTGPPSGRCPSVAASFRSGYALASSCSEASMTPARFLCERS